MFTVGAEAVGESAEGAIGAMLGQDDAVLFDADVDVVAFPDVEGLAELGGQHDATQVIDLA